MEKKTASWGKRPTEKPTTIQSVNSFVNGSGARSLVRLNVQISEDLHKRVKSQCAIEGTSMRDLITEFLESRFPEK